MARFGFFSVPAPPQVPLVGGVITNAANAGLGVAAAGVGTAMSAAVAGVGAVDAGVDDAGVDAGAGVAVARVNAGAGISSGAVTADVGLCGDLTGVASGVGVVGDGVNTSLGFTAVGLDAGIGGRGAGVGLATAGVGAAVGAAKAGVDAGAGAAKAGVGAAVGAAKAGVGVAKASVDAAVDAAEASVHAAVDAAKEGVAATLDVAAACGSVVGGVVDGTLTTLTAAAANIPGLAEALAATPILLLDAKLTAIFATALSACRAIFAWLCAAAVWLLSGCVAVLTTPWTPENIWLACIALMRPPAGLVLYITTVCISLCVRVAPATTKAVSDASCAAARLAARTGKVCVTAVLDNVWGARAAAAAASAGVHEIARCAVRAMDASAQVAHMLHAAACVAFGAAVWLACMWVRLLCGVVLAVRDAGKAMLGAFEVSVYTLSMVMSRPQKM